MHLPIVLSTGLTEAGYEYQIVYQQDVDSFNHERNTTLIAVDFLEDCKYFVLKGNQSKSLSGRTFEDSMKYLDENKNLLLYSY